MATKILIVEDEPLIAFDMEETVTGAGFHVVHVARDVDEAMQTISQEPIDLAVLDANLAGKSAEPIAEQLRSSGVPFVIISGYSRGQLGAWVGPSPIVSKPYVPGALIDEIRRLLTAQQDYDRGTSSF